MHTLAERDADLAALDTAIGRALSGEGALVFVEGPPGIGKSSLLAACRARAADAGMRVLAARGSELERGFAHGVVRQLLERAVAAVGEEERARLFDGPAAQAADAVMGLSAERRHAGPGDAEFAVLHGLHWLVANLADSQPLLCVIDDAHWADAASLRFGCFLAGRLQELGVLVVIATRPGEPGAETALLAELAAAAGTMLHPAALTGEGTAAVIADRLGAEPTEAFAAAVHEASGGNPFLLGELLSALSSDGLSPDDTGARRVRTLGPQSVSRAVFLRLSRLPAGAVAFARAIAILGDDVELRDAAALAGLPLADAGSLADDLVASGVLGPRRPLSFAHPVIREAVAADVGPGERTTLHAAAAALLHARGATPEQVASHLVATEISGEPWAIAALTEVAARAQARGVPDVAASYLLRALAEPSDATTRGALLAALGEAEWLAGQDLPLALEHLREADALSEVPEERTRIAIMLARAIFSGGDIIGAIRSLAGSIQAHGALAGSEGVMRMEAELGSMAVLNISLMPEARERLAPYAELPGDTPGEMLMLGPVSALAAMYSTADRAADTARRSLGGGRLLAAETSDSVAFFQAVFVLAWTDEADEARAAAEAALAEARERGSALGYGVACGVSASVAWNTGDIQGCEAHARAGLELPAPFPFVLPSLHIFLGLALVERGELDEAEDALAAGWVGPHLPELVHFNPGFYARGLLRAAQGRDEEALADLREFAVRNEDHCEVGNPAMAWRIPAAEACLRLGRREEAVGYVERHEERAAHWGTRAARGVGLYGRALLADRAEQAALLGDAVALLERSPARREHAYAVVALGAALRRANQRSDAQVRLAEGVELALACGATRLAQRANEELATAGAKPRRLQFSGADSLTASERRVAGMAAEGLSSPQIAQALFVTPKTVENHLGRVYGKLGIRSRRELAGALTG